MGFVQPPHRLHTLRLEHQGVEGGVLARRVLVEHVEIAVLDQRLGSQQVVRLVAAVVGAGEGVEPERPGVHREQQEPEEGGARPHRVEASARPRAPGR